MLERGDYDMGLNQKLFVELGPKNRTHLVVYDEENEHYSHSGAVMDAVQVYVCLGALMYGSMDVWMYVCMAVRVCRCMCVYVQILPAKQALLRVIKATTNASDT